MRTIGAALVILLGVAGCDDAEPTECEPGERRACPAAAVDQICGADGRWQACPGAPDAGASDAGSRDAGGGGLDAGERADAGAPDASTGGCGAERPDVSGISGTEGLVIARDGTIYYSQAGGVGRLVPGGAPEPFVTLGDARTTVWGVVLDPANEHLFVGVPGRGVVAVDLTLAPPTTSTLVSGGAPNGLTFGPDGMLYYSDFSAGRVYRVDPAGGAPTEVTTSTIANANGVAFAPDGTLLVCSYSTGTLLRLTLTGGTESARETVASSLGAPDGVALDEDGRIYVTDNGGGTLIRLEADGTAPMTLETGIGAAASVEFGHGALSCSDLYVASSGPMRRHELGTANGAAVPWH